MLLMFMLMFMTWYAAIVSKLQAFTQQYNILYVHKRELMLSNGSHG